MKRGMLLFVLSLAQAAACREEPPLSLVIDALLPDTPVGGVRTLLVEADARVMVTVELRDGLQVRTRKSRAPARSHEIPILGLPAGELTEVVVRAADAQGRTASRSLLLEGDALPERFPRIDVLASEPERMEPGYTLFVIRMASKEADPVVILDAWGRPVWWFQPEIGVGDLRFTERGTIVGIGDGSIYEFSLLGEDLRHIDVEGEDLHHELYPLPDGGWLTPRTRPFPEPRYPTDPLDPRGPSAPAVLDDHEILKLDADGNVRSAWALSERLDTTRVSEESFNQAQRGRKDWAHVNAVIPDPRDGGTIVSLRHQDAIIKLDAEGELVWILGDPGGWVDPWAERLLTPVPNDGSFPWAYHQHAPQLVLDPERPEETLLVLFDNHNHGRTLYEPVDEELPQTSRVAAFRIDEEQRTVSFAWELSETTTGPLYSGANGDADVLPLTGNVLANFGMVTQEQGVSNEERGMGTRLVRFVEWDRADPSHPVMDFRLWGPQQTEPGGWQAYRVDRIPSLYADP